VPLTTIDIYENARPRTKTKTNQRTFEQLFLPYTSDERKNNRESAEGTKTRLERRALEKRCIITTCLWERKPAKKEITIETRRTPRWKIICKNCPGNAAQAIRSGKMQARSMTTAAIAVNCCR